MNFLNTTRLCLRPIKASDAADIQHAASDREIADTMISLPHPYPAGQAMQYTARLQKEMANGLAVAFVIRDRNQASYKGLIELRAIDREHSLGELSFWLAKTAWGHGYMQEALPAVVLFGLETLGLNRLYAYHMLRNPASGKVLEKTGFKQEGLLRQRVRKWGMYEDVALWALLREDWETMHQELSS